MALPPRKEGDVSEEQIRRVAAEMRAEGAPAAADHGREWVRSLDAAGVVPAGQSPTEFLAKRAGRTFRVDPQRPIRTVVRPRNANAVGDDLPDEAKVSAFGRGFIDGYNAESKVVSVEAQAGILDALAEAQVEGRMPPDVAVWAGSGGWVKLGEAGQDDIACRGLESPRQAPEARQVLVEEWAPGGVFHQAAKSGLVSALNGTSSSYAYTEIRHLTDADLWWVSAELLEVVEAAAKDVPRETTAAELTPPSESGLAFFEVPRVGVDSKHGQAACRVSAILWGTGELGPVPEIGRHVPVVCLTVSSYALMDLPNGSSAWVPLGRSDWPLADRLDHPLGTNLPREEYHQSAMDDRRLIAALWGVAEQTLVTESTTETPDRASRRRAEREGRPAPKGVRVVRLRRVRAATGETSGERLTDRRWGHRTIVRGHWRRQVCGKGRQDRRLTWIRPHVAGPADAPLVVRETVTMLAR